MTLIGPTHVGVPSHWVRGIITSAEAGSEGAVVWARASYEWTDLSGRLTIGNSAMAVESRVVLYGNEQRSRAFMVDKVVGLLDVEREQVHPLPPHFRGGERDRLLGYLVGSAYVALIANPFWVLELPSHNEVLDTFQVSERRSAHSGSMLRFPSTSQEDAVPASSHVVK